MNVKMSVLKSLQEALSRQRVDPIPGKYRGSGYSRGSKFSLLSLSKKFVHMHSMVVWVGVFLSSLDLYEIWTTKKSGSSLASCWLTSSVHLCRVLIASDAEADDSDIGLL
jgi:hypothetical protein